MSKKRLLFISSRPLYPIIGGDQIRTVQQLDYLKEQFDVDVVYISSDNKDIKYLDNYGGIGNIFRFQVPKWKSILQTLRFLINDKPLQVNYFFNRAIQKKINNIITEYDCVFCNNIRTAEYVRSKTGIIKFLDFVDAISMNYDKARYQATGLRKIMYSLDYKRCRVYEQQCLEYFDSCAVISDIDKNYILSWKK